MAIYPAQYETTAVLRDGSSLVLVRPICPDDVGAVLAFHARLSPLSLYHRFFSPVPRLAPEQLRHLVEVDYVDSMALVAQQDERIVGVTHCFRYKGGYHADVSVAVEDACQGQGIGPTLLEHLTHLARDRGITVFDADVLAENRRMLRILAQTGLPMSRVLHMGVVHVEISLTSRTSSGGPLG